MSGFSIWHVDNVLGSFYAHSSVDCPANNESFDLHQILLRYPNCHLSVNKKSPSVSHDLQISSNSNASSGWDILGTLSRTSYFVSTPHFERIWRDKGSDLRRPISIWRPIPRPGYAPLGDCITEGFVFNFEHLPFISLILFLTINCNLCQVRTTSSWTSFQI